MKNIRNYLAFSGFGLLLWYFVQFSTEAGEASARAQTVVTLSVGVEQKSETNLVLRVRLTNTGTNNLAVPLGYLPWDRYAMTIVLVKANDPFSVPLRQETGIADPPPGQPHRILSGQTLEGHINLNHRFPDLADQLRRGDLIFFWSYQCPAEGVSVDRIGGWIVIPQAKL